MPDNLDINLPGGSSSIRSTAAAKTTQDKISGRAAAGTGALTAHEKHRETADDLRGSQAKRSALLPCVLPETESMDEHMAPSLTAA